jgi:hypothetical protein
VRALLGYAPPVSGRVGRGAHLVNETPVCVALLQPCRGAQARRTSANDKDVHLLDARRAPVRHREELPRVKSVCMFVHMRTLDGGAMSGRGGDLREEFRLSTVAADVATTGGPSAPGL